MSDILADLGLGASASSTATTAPISTFSPTTPFNGQASGTYVPNGYTASTTTPTGSPSVIVSGGALVTGAFTNISNPFPTGINRPFAAAPASLALFGSNPAFLNQSRVVPYNQQWQFDVQHQFGANTIVELAYVGMLSVKEFESFNLDDEPLFDQTLANKSIQYSNPFLPGTNGAGGVGVKCTSGGSYCSYFRFRRRQYMSQRQLSILESRLQHCQRRDGENCLTSHHGVSIPAIHQPDGRQSLTPAAGAITHSRHASRNA